MHPRLTIREYVQKVLNGEMHHACLLFLTDVLVERTGNLISVAAENGNVHAQFLMGRITKDPTWFEKAAKQGYPHALDALDKTRKPTEDEWKTLENDAKAGNADAQCVLGNFYSKKVGNIYKSRAEYLKAATKNHPIAQHQFFELMQIQEPTTAFEMCESSAKQGYAPAQSSLGRLYVESRNNPNLGIQWISAAVRQGHTSDQAYLEELLSHSHDDRLDAISEYLGVLTLAHAKRPGARERFNQLVREEYSTVYETLEPDDWEEPQPWLDADVIHIVSLLQQPAQQNAQTIIAENTRLPKELAGMISEYMFFHFTPVQQKAQATIAENTGLPRNLADMISEYMFFTPPREEKAAPVAEQASTAEMRL